MGPDHANMWANIGKTGPGKTFGAFPWICSADGVILAYLAAARAATQSNSTNPPSLPDRETHIAALYSQSTEEDQVKLHKVLIIAAQLLIVSN